MAKHRINRINEEMKKELANIIKNEIKDPRMKAMVSVTGVDVTQDLKYAKVYLSIFSQDKAEEKETLQALNTAKGFIRKRLSATVNLRNTPELTFIEDTSIDYGMHIDSLLADIAGKGVTPDPEVDIEEEEEDDRPEETNDFAEVDGLGEASEDDHVDFELKEDEDNTL